jgi:rubrerythrin
MLEKLDMEGVAKAKIEKVPDLKISDYMSKIEFKPNLSYTNILRIAMKMEEKSLKLYNDLKKLFHLLANEEAKHKLRLEKIYDEEILK